MRYCALVAFGERKESERTSMHRKKERKTHVRGYITQFKCNFRIYSVRLCSWNSFGFCVFSTSQFSPGYCVYRHCLEILTQPYNKTRTCSTLKLMMHWAVEHNIVLIFGLLVLLIVYFDAD